MKVSTMAVLACAAAALAACASGPGGGGRDREPIRALMSADALLFVSFDADADLRVSGAEIEAGLAREFARADANRDASLQPIEFQNWSASALGGGQVGPYRLDFDRNVDNVVTSAEFSTEIQARARDYDADENGMLARAEFVRLVGQARAPRERREAPPLGDVSRH